MFLFDLDGTLIDSSKRTVKALASGQFCLKTYLAECNSPKQINKDTLLPLASYAQALAKKGDQFAILTARYLTEVDHAFLKRHGLVNELTIFLDRSTVSNEIRALNDADYKLYQLDRLESFYDGYAVPHYTLFDDMPDILQALGYRDNCTTVDAVALNKALKNKSELIQQSDTVNAFTAFSRSATRDQFDAFLTSAKGFAV